VLRARREHDLDRQREQRPQTFDDVLALTPFVSDSCGISRPRPKSTSASPSAVSFISAFPDIEVFMDDLVFKDETAEYHWTFTGTNTGTERYRKLVSDLRLRGVEVWRRWPRRRLSRPVRPGRLRPPARARRAAAIAGGCLLVE